MPLPLLMRMFSCAGWPAAAARPEQDEEEDVLARLERQRARAGDAGTAAGWVEGVSRQSAAACAVCTGMTAETTQCPRCLPGKPAVHKICEDEWLMRKHVCIFCRLPVRRIATHVPGPGVEDVHRGPAVFMYRSPTNKMLSARVSALRKAISVGHAAGCELAERDRQAAASARSSRQSKRPGAGGGTRRQVALSRSEAKSRLAALYKKSSRGSGRHAMDEVSVTAVLEFAAELYGSTPVLPRWVVELIERVVSCVPLMEGRCIAASLTALATLASGSMSAAQGSHPAGVAPPATLHPAEIARRRLERLEGPMDVHPDCPPHTHTPELGPAPSRANESQRRLYQKALALLSDRGAAPQMAATFSAHSSSVALTALGRLRQSRKNPLVVTLCQRIAVCGAEAATDETGAIPPAGTLGRGLARNPLEHGSMSTNMLVDLAEALSLLSPPAEGHASSNAIQEEGELQQGKDTATAAPPGMAVWRQALDRLAEALAGRVDSMDAKRLVRITAAFAAMPHKHEWLLVRTAARLMSPQVAASLRGGHVAVVTHALAVLRHPDPALLHVLAAAAMAREVMLTMTPDDARTILRACAALGLENPALRAALGPIAEMEVAVGEHAGVGAANQALVEASAVTAEMRKRSKVVAGAFFARQNVQGERMRRRDLALATGLALDGAE